MVSIKFQSYVIIIWSYILKSSAIAQHISPVWLFHFSFVFYKEAIFDGERGHSAHVFDGIHSQPTGHFIILLSAFGIEEDGLGGESEGDTKEGNRAQDDQGDDPRVAKGNAQGEHCPDKRLDERTNAVTSSLCVARGDWIKLIVNTLYDSNHRVKRLYK